MHKISLPLPRDLPATSTSVQSPLFYLKSQQSPAKSAAVPQKQAAAGLDEGECLFSKSAAGHSKLSNQPQITAPIVGNVLLAEDCILLVDVSRYSKLKCKVFNSAPQPHSYVGGFTISCTTRYYMPSFSYLRTDSWLTELFMEAVC